jgi:hypothetical protein|tara:strand:- start:48 stop:332 length:285 start_codon:yes stop_codon:yes gene_type:complete
MKTKIEFLDNEETSTIGLSEVVEPDTALKNMLVTYVGEKKSTTDEVTVEMIVDTMAEEFPDFILALAEENWVRGYQQAFFDLRGDLESDVEQPQ